MCWPVCVTLYGVQFAVVVFEPVSEQIHGVTGGGGVLDPRFCLVQCFSYLLLGCRHGRSVFSLYGWRKIKFHIEIIQVLVRTFVSIW